MSYRFAALILISVPPLSAADSVDYVRDVQPILKSNCYSCHGTDKQSSGLRLDRKRDALNGGDSGKVILPGKGTESLLIKLVSGGDTDRPMPPSEKNRLTKQQIDTLRIWIDEGARWPDDHSVAKDMEWWSLKPIAKLEPPKTSEGAWVRNGIDAFVIAKLREKKLTPSVEADRRTLCRRLTYDLTGLPPTLEQMTAFENDSSPHAYEKFVDSLLADPGYGERWARHWLDVVHYGDTHGYDKEQPRPNAYHYRDYVIRSFNSDKPYERFIREQLAGDVLWPGTVDGVTALGFIAAGPWDFIGHAEVPETKIDGKIARHLDRDDMVSNTMGTFVSMTVHCAQCHNHKFDPIPQEDYYRLQAVFAALDRADRPFYSDANTAKQAGELQTAKTTLRSRLGVLDQRLKVAGGAALAELEARIAAARKAANVAGDHGYHSAIELRQDVVKWVQVDLGESKAIAKIILWPCHDNFNMIGAGFGYPVRFKIEASDDAEFKKNVTTVVDRTTADTPKPSVEAQTFPIKATARYLRVTATQLSPRLKDYIFALAELEALDATDRNLAAGCVVTAFDSIEHKTVWTKSNLTNGTAPGKSRSGLITDLQRERDTLMAKVADPMLISEIATTNAEMVSIDQKLARYPATGRVYAGTVHTGSGAFRGTGPDGGKPRPIHLLNRGNVLQPGKEVQPGALRAVTGLPATFVLPPHANEGMRRVALAEWIASPRNPLTWRSLVNRVWQYHFGRGLAGTPNDFGRMGQPPSHPELLDWLAMEFRDNGQSLKKLHKLIVMSATYRQSSASHSANVVADPENLWLWRQSRRKLEAEEIRDSVLCIAGKLDRKLYGPGFQDFVIKQPEHSPHYEYDQFDPNDPKGHRRSIYRFLVRSKPQPFMVALDCADPSMQVDRRNETLSPVQALALFNNKLILTMAKHLAARVEKSADPLGQAFQLAIGRLPSEKERSLLTEYSRTHGFPGTCRVILNLNEFAFVD